MDLKCCRNNKSQCQTDDRAVNDDNQHPSNIESHSASDDDDDDDANDDSDDGTAEDDDDNDDSDYIDDDSDSNDNDDDDDGEDYGGGGDGHHSRIEVDDVLPESLHFKNLKHKIQPLNDLTKTQREMKKKLAACNEEAIDTFTSHNYKILTRAAQNTIKPKQNKKTLSSQKKFLSLCHDIHTSKKFDQKIATAFNINVDQIEISHRLIAGKVYSLIRAEVQKVLCSDAVSPQTTRHADLSTDNLPDAVRGKMRYVGGYVVKTLIQRKVDKIRARADLYQNKLKYDILKNMTISEATIHKTTTDAESLQQTERKQNMNHGLINITDSCYAFFIRFICILNSHYTVSALAAHRVDIFQVVFASVMADYELLKAFHQCIVMPSDYSSNSDIIDVINRVVDSVVAINELYTDIVILMMRTYQAEFRKRIMDTNVTKTFARRTAVLMPKGAKRVAELDEGI